MGGFNIQWETL